MGVLVYVLGRSGTGKSFSMRNFDKGKFAVVNVQGKILPFKGAASVVTTHTDQSEKIVKAVKDYAKTYKSIVVDDFQYVMANEFMRRSTERGYDKFTEIARHAWDIADCVRELPSDVIVYVMCHTDTDQEGTERLKTIGKLLDEKINIPGMFTIVLKTSVSDGKYSFMTQNSGHDPVKSPMGMFAANEIDNDLKAVIDRVMHYYEMPGAPGDKVEETPEEKPAKEAPIPTEEQPAPEEAPRRRRRREK